MGFLQGDTNNIILDAVLTDTGRQFLARNDGSFSVVKFAAGDDEVDYTVIQKYGRTVGKEKIEKNTPIFEALTNGSLAQKYRCVSVSNNNLIRLPNLTFTGEGVDSTNTIVSIGNTTVKRRTLTVFQDIQDETSIDVELRDQAFIVELSNQFLQVVGSAPDNIDGQQRATYILTRDAGETALGGSRITFTMATKAISDSQFQVYGTTANKNQINTYVKISGVQSGTVLEFQVQIASAT
ncbi:MAG: hypothetical protein WC761_00705 [Candidatus Paceibacterota bacterium]|jgi:hypothetical protein